MGFWGAEVVKFICRSDQLGIWKQKRGSQGKEGNKHEKMNERNQENKSYLISSSLANGFAELFPKHSAKHHVAANKLPGSCPIYSF